MSRIGKKPIDVPANVSVAIADGQVTIDGPKGSLTQTIPAGVTVSQDDAVLSVERNGDDRQSRALHGLTRSLVANMVEGVTNGFRRDLEIHGVGYRAVPKGDSSIELMLGFSHKVVVDAPEGVTFAVPSPTKIEVHGHDKQLVGQVAANIRSLRKPEPYKGKGVRYANEVVIIKETKKK